MDQSTFSFILSVIAAFVYALIGWQASGEKFDEKKFLRTLIIQVLAAFGLSASGLGASYASPLSCTAITVIVQKLINWVAPNFQTSSQQQSSSSAQPS